MPLIRKPKASADATRATAPATASLLFQAMTPIMPSPITPVTSSPIAAQPPSAVAER
jgi:hypothetical protein